MKLGELIQKRKQETGLSLEKLAVRARDAGYDLTRTTLATFQNHPLAESPRRRTMEALAIALGVSYEDVVLAVADSMLGDDADMTDVSDRQHVQSFIALTKGRDATQIEGLLQIVRSAADAIDRTAQRPGTAGREA